MNLPSKLIEQAVDEMSSLPGIGRKTALRLVLHLLRKKPEHVKRFSEAFTAMREGIAYCSECYNLSDTPVCTICSNPSRDNSILCIVEDIRDVMAIESTQFFKGKYHVLGGLISPMDGIGPEELQIDSLVNRIAGGEVKEIIMALNTTIEGDTTSFYIYRKIKEFDLKVTTIARGVAVGDELEYTDEITLGRSIQNRTPYENSLAR